MDIKSLWKDYKFPNCETCSHNCQGRLDYDNLCSNLNYLKEYGEENYIKNKESFNELKNIMCNKMPTIFSYGCGLGLDFVCATEIFGNNIKYYGIDDINWAIKETDNYKNFEPKLPKTIKFDVGNFLLDGIHENLVICFFNSLFTISNNSELDKILFNALKSKNDFYIVCDYTINSNFHMPKEEQDFLNKLENKLKPKFYFKHFDILDGRGIIISGKRR